MAPKKDKKASKSADQADSKPDKARVPRQSPAIEDARIEELLKLYPEAGTEGAVDVERLKEAIGKDAEAPPDRYSFGWAGKREAIQLLQVPSRATLSPNPDKSVAFDDAQNLFIEGDNLEVLKLLYRPYFNRVKLVYLDPPYNTGGDFIYPDNFADPLDAYLRLTGQVSENGDLLTSNPEGGGRFHSSWLSMMYPRLFIARQVLKDDGLLVVSIDDNEFANLRLLLNEIFGEENFMGTVVWNSTKTVTNTALISKSHTYNLIFAKSKDYFVKNRSHFRVAEPGEGFSNPDNDPRGPWKADPFQVGGERPNQLYEITNPKTGKVYTPNKGSSWKNEFKVFEQLMEDNRIVFGVSGEAGPQRKRFQSEAEERGKVAKTLWDDVDTTSNATRALDELFGRHVFDNPKPVDLIKRFIELGVHDPEDAIVMDFFAGSCPTAEAVLQLNQEDGGSRRFICVQLPEPTEEDPDYETIADIGADRIRKVIDNLPESKEGEGPAPGFRHFSLGDSNFNAWEGVEGDSAEDYVGTMEMFEDPLKKDTDTVEVIHEVALREGFGLNREVSQVADLDSNTVWRVTDPDRDQSFLLSLDEVIDEKTINALELEESDVFICRDRALTDSLAANLALQCELRAL